MALVLLSVLPWPKAAVIRRQIPDIWRTGLTLPTLVPIRCMQAAQEHTHSCQPSWSGWGLVADTMLRTEMDQNWSSFTLQAFPWKSQAFVRLQSSKIYQTHSASLGNQIPVLPALPFHQNPLPSLKLLLISGGRCESWSPGDYMSVGKCEKSLSALPKGGY